ncbi:DUF4242 domain-containing protein [Dactylosporangium vinaceum]|uniref:Nickel-binding protein n=1 Tax=Dactylosporangium vinaceum TaxID=53362 RepID=A0ABV5MHP3_9ACTN|nr:nickel-binding protein [Dactylosporangium vinaceum]UAB99108.1 DUF4242 domain-containing protein [Dactylosporangium vinaceum]
MATFLDVHGGYADVSPQELTAALAVDRACAEPEGVRLGRGWLDRASGLMFRVVHGPDRETILRVQERAGHPATELVEIPQ